VVADRQPEGAEDAPLVESNRRRAVVICSVPGLAVGVIVGVVLAGIGLPLVGVVALVVLAVGVALGLWQAAPTVVLRAVGARASDEGENPRLHNLVDGLCATMGLPRPTVFVVDSPVPNAMAVGRDPASASLVVTTGLVRVLTLVELEGVLAHELVHIKRADTLVAGVAVVATVPWSFLRGVEKGADTVHHLIGPGREFAADQRAAGVVRYPPGISAALESMVDGSIPSPAWPPGSGRTAALTRWTWIDPVVGAGSSAPVEGDLDDTRVRAAAISLL
jgi:heat shock protein HtpX